MKREKKERDIGEERDASNEQLQLMVKEEDGRRRVRK